MMFQHWVYTAAYSEYATLLAQDYIQKWQTNIIYIYIFQNILDNQLSDIYNKEYQQQSNRHQIIIRAV